MRIDWKHLATTPGYRSLKAAVHHKHGWPKKETYPLFHKIIAQAHLDAERLGKQGWEVLNQWEEERTYNWRNYYEHMFRDNPKARQSEFNRDNPRSWRRHYNKSWLCRSDSPAKRKERMCKKIQEIQAAQSKRQGKKKRWANERKKREARLR